jgi:hypothetical protein
MFSAMTLGRVGVLFLVAAAGLGVEAQQAGHVDPLARLRADHPRLIATEASWPEIAMHRSGNERLGRLIDAVVAGARMLETAPPVERRLIGRRLLSASRTALERTLALSLAYRVTKQDAFARRAEREMLAAAAFPDWNPPHYLDVAEMTAALAIGYDWLHDALSAASRAAIRRAIVEKGLTPALDAKASWNGWQRAENNWNQVCFGGLTLGALAVAEDEPALARQILLRARQGIAHGLKPYAPDGVYPEGPGYWSYGTSFQVLMISALESALGTDWGLSASQGFTASAQALLQQVGPTGLLFNFSDCREPAVFEPALLWFARKAGDAHWLAPHLPLLDAMLRRAESSGETRRLLPLAAIWWPDEWVSEASSLPRYWKGDGPNPIAVFRSSWNDPNALYLAVKGGSAGLNHAHMDAGTFVFERDGVRWARDLGMQEYESLESKGVDLWNRRQDSQRWQVFRLNNRSHNTLTVDGRLHAVAGDARIVGFSAAATEPYATIELSSTFHGQAQRVRRRFTVLGERGVLVQDEMEGVASGTPVRWAMVTAAEVAASGAQATLHENGRTLTVRLLEPEGAFEVIPADPPKDAFNAPNPGRRILSLTARPRGDGTLRIGVQLGEAQ